MKLTCHLAADAIAEPGFPRDGLLPRIDPVPYNNLGHMPLIDYPLVCQLLWGCAAEMVTTRAESIRACRPRAIRLAAAMFAAFLFAAVSPLRGTALVTALTAAGITYLALGVRASAHLTSGREAGSREQPPPSRRLRLRAAGVAAIVFLTVLGMSLPGTSGPTVSSLCFWFAATGLVYWIVSRRGVRDACASVKARYIESLLKEQIPPTPQCEAFRAFNNNNRPLVQVGVGDGDLRRDRLLVSFATGRGALLPGLGRLWVQDQYVCPPKPSEGQKRPERSDLAALNGDLESTIERVGSALPSARCSTTSGALVVVDANGLHSESPWLAGGQPRLFLPREGDVRDVLAAADRLDKDARARVFFGIQVFFPNYSTLVTLAARVFFASDAAAVELLVASLGPPRTQRRTLRERLAWHKRYLRFQDPPQEKPPTRFGAFYRSHLATRAHALRDLLRRRQDPLRTPVDWSQLSNLFARDERTADEKVEAERLAETTDCWIGMHTRVPNWREARSLAISNEFFDAAECAASVRAVYTQIVEATLTSLEQQGYNVDAYRDARGKLTINTGWIEQLVVADRAEIKNGDHKAPAAPASAPSVTPTASPTQTIAPQPTTA